MATTPNLGLAQLEIGQKEKEVTINTNNTLIDTAFATRSKYLGDLAADPTPTAELVGARYYNTTSNVFRTLRNATTWING